ncbi:MAG: hypothetical protein AAGC63_11900, partial [Propionicimonas sp.]|nr:hypothetical protein [Propionicimonas sp.]
ILGWPESTPAQVVMLELAALPLQASLGIGLWQLSRRMRAPGRRGRLALGIAAGLAGLGALLVALAYLTGPRSMVHLGLVLIWLGLLAAMLVVITHLPRRPLRAGTFTAIAEPGDADDDASDDPLATAPLAGPEDGSIESRRD